MNKQFGIELELVDITRGDALTAIRNLDINISEESRNNHDHTDGQWKLTSDGSVTSNSGQSGIEIVSPILHNDAGLAEACKVAQALKDAGAKINKTCGFHVHFDANHLTTGQLRMIAYRYATYETEIDAFMPPSRRDNRYCKTNRERNLRFYYESNKERFCEHAYDDRYRKVNLQAYARHHTIEFRQHSGTCEPYKIRNWVNFLAQFIDRSCVLDARYANLYNGYTAFPNPHLTPRERKFFNLLNVTRSGTASIDSLCMDMQLKPKQIHLIAYQLRQKGYVITTIPYSGSRFGYTLNPPIYNTILEYTSSLRHLLRLDNIYSEIDFELCEYFKHRTQKFAA